MNTLAWALFLAVSWTWCIGMYLPTLMVRDGGVPFFLAFLIPNVLGAASVGWLLRNADRSRRFVEPRRTMMLAFSAVTIAFHAYFLTWRAGLDWNASRPETIGGIVLGASLVGNAIAARRRVDWFPALVTLFFSFALAVLLVAFPIEETGSADHVAVAGLAMVTGLGFLLCPYLDLTFNRACQHARRPAAAFTLGFFVFFLATILVATRGRVVWTPREAPFFAMSSWLSTAAGCHFGAQAMFTCCAHIAAVRRLGIDGGITRELIPEPARPRMLAWVVVPACAGWLIGLAMFAVDAVTADGTLDLPGFASPITPHEFAYRLFLGAYGLVFPAWMLMATRRRADLDPGTLAWTAAACVLAGPFLWLGAVGRDEVWLFPGVGLVLVLAAIRFTLARRPEAA
jgi:hypothetical protein